MRTIHRVDYNSIIPQEFRDIPAELVGPLFTQVCIFQRETGDLVGNPFTVRSLYLVNSILGPIGEITGEISADNSHADFV